MKKSYIILILGTFVSLFLPVYSMEDFIEDASDPVNTTDYSIPKTSNFAEKEATLAEKEANTAQQSLHSYIDKNQEKLSRRVIDDPQVSIEQTDEDPLAENAYEEVARLKTAAQKKALIAKNKRNIANVQARLQKTYDALNNAQTNLKEFTYNQNSPEYEQAQKEMDSAKKDNEYTLKLLSALKDKGMALSAQPIDSIELSKQDIITMQSVLERNDGFKI